MILSLRNFLLIFFFSLFSLSGGETKGGREIRIVSLSPALTEIVFHLGAGKTLVGRSDVCNYPAEVKKIPAAGSFGIPSVEKIVRLAPDCLISNALVNPIVARRFASLGIQCEWNQCASLEDYLFWVKKIGSVTGREKEAARECARAENLIRAFREKANSIPEEKKIRVAWVIWDTPLMLAGKGSFPDFELKLAGLKNVASEVSPEYFKASLEWLLKSDPDVILWPLSRKGVLESLKKKSPWNTLSAVRNNRVLCELNEDLLLRPGPRMFDGIPALGEKVGECFRGGK